jgi:hypothetical protein
MGIRSPGRKRAMRMPRAAPPLAPRELTPARIPILRAPNAAPRRNMPKTKSDNNKSEVTGFAASEAPVVVLTNADQMKNEIVNPSPTPDVILQPRTPAKARGNPRRLATTIQTIAGALKPVPPPSEKD